VGVNKYQSGIEDQVEAREIDNTAVREQQIARLAEIRASRDQEAVGAALAELGVAAYEGHGNLLELAVRATRLRHGRRDFGCAGTGVGPASRSQPDRVRRVFGRAGG
jgi:methylmalonyl-CoA mutase N-terminal domain/subunit